MAEPAVLTIMTKLNFKLILFFGLVSGFFSGAYAQNSGNIWKPVTPQELAQTESKVEPGADAEAIFWEVQLDDKKSNRLSYDHYVRVKIFTERGREKFSKLDIPFYKGRKVEDVAARVIKSDGTIINLQPSDIFDREIIKAGKIKVNAKSFAVPGIEPGVIVEYKYSEVVKNDSLNGESLVFQREIPMQSVRYSVRPFKGSRLNFQYRNMPEMRFTETEDGFWVGALTNVPSVVDEPRMPPEDEVRFWVSLSYTTFGSAFNWTFFGSGLGQYLKNTTKSTKEIKVKSAELTAGIGTPEAKLRRIYEFSQTRIRNVSYDPAYTDELRGKLKIDDANDVLKSGIGTSGHIDILFAALAKAAGFNIALVMSGDRSQNFFSPSVYNNRSYVHPAGIGVIVDNKWKVFNPGTPYMPFGRVDWYEEITHAMFVEETMHNWRIVPFSSPEESPARRKGDFELLEDGTLQGLVRLEYEGHQATSRRRAGFRDSPNKREEEIKEEFKDYVKNAEITDITIENFEVSDKPLIYIFKIKVPNYGQRTGKRLFFQPGVFESGTSPIFSSSTRKHSIYFAYSLSEKDAITIKYPQGLELDAFDPERSVTESNKIGAVSIRTTNDKTARILKIDREYFFGGGGQLIFEASAYQPIKKLFDSFHKADTQSFTLKQP